ncbi:uncharacterized protein LOC125489905 [Plutella xylostella]|uniref:uncharacterized protein LOC125489905 n=1 Tax=Plutella xylostella TaxID=51655 RepID=UPI002032C051|nr:uncharacterized protein LOC125489905 [Plutella xylostella]
MASVIGNLSVFDYKIHEWEIFHGRLLQFIKLNNIEEEHKSAVLLTHISEEAYKLVRNLAYPRSVEEVDFHGLVKLLNGHFTPKRSIFADRARFYDASRGDGESVEDWAARLRGLAIYCEFGGALDTLLLDRFVLGLGAGPQRDRLVEQDAVTLTLAKAMEMAQQTACARAARAAMHAAEAPVYLAGCERRAAPPRAPRRAEPGGAPAAAESTQRCAVCGLKAHEAIKCRFKNYKCRKCGEKGHLKKVCKKAGSHLHNVEADAEVPGVPECEDCQCFNVRYVSYDPIKVTVNVNNVNLSMEIDSGSGTCIISHDLYIDRFRNCNLQKCNIRMCLYNGHKITPVGYFVARVTYLNQTEDVRFYVIKNGGPPLLGREFMSKFNMHFTTSVNNVALSVPDVDVQQLMKQYPDIWKDELGCFNKFEVDLHLKDGATPKFFKPRNIPFALKERVEEELDRLVRAGILVPVRYSQYATPIVPVLKENGVVNYYRNFIPNASSLLAPLHELLKAGARWEWTRRHGDALAAVRRELASDRVLAHFDPAAQLVLAVDAGPAGLGAVLAHVDDRGRERPIAFASRSLLPKPIFSGVDEFSRPRTESCGHLWHSLGHAYVEQWRIPDDDD